MACGLAEYSGGAGRYVFITDDAMRYGFNKLHELLTVGYLDARRSERATTAALEFELDLERNIADLAHALVNRAWSPGRMEWFVVDKPTVREVFAPSFRDRVVSHVLFNLLAPIYERYFIHDTCSCRKGRGTLFGIERFEHHVRSVTDNYRRPAWILNIDISGYFMSIDRRRLREMIADTMEREKTARPEAADYSFILWLVDAFLDRDPTRDCVFIGKPELVPLVPKNKSLFGRAPGIGLPIGDVINQLNSNIYLTPFDYFVKRELGIRNYIRYVDDAKAMHRDRDYLEEVKERSSEYLRDRLGLTVHPDKTTILDVLDAPDFLGAVMLPYRRYARRATVDATRRYFLEASRALEAGTATPEDLLPNINSRLGYLSHFNEWRATDRIVRACPELRKSFQFNQKLTKAKII